MVSKTRKVRKALSAMSLGFAGILLFAHSALAQGCALCYNDASATGQQGIAALRHGILILAIPPMLIFAALFGILYKRRNAHHDAIQPSGKRTSVHSVSEIVLHLN
jgi:hypothetical protein